MEVRCGNEGSLAIMHALPTFFLGILGRAR